jgi:CRISPR-associated protein Cas4
MITVTDLCDYVWCPYQVYLKKVRKIRPPPTPQMVRGILVHKVKEDVSNSERILLENRVNESSSIEEIRKVIFNNAYQCAKNAVLRDRSSLEGVGLDPMDILSELKKDLYYDSISTAARLKRALERADLHTALEMMYPECKMECMLEDRELDLRGRIDRYEHVGDVTIPIDYKSGNFKGEVTDSQRVQIAAYAIMLERGLNTRVPFGLIEYTNLDRILPVIVDQYARNEVMEILDKVKKIVYEKKEPEKNRDWRCDYCSFKEHCI